MRQYEWNSRNQLVAVRQGATLLAAYQYDGFGRRITKTVGGMTTAFLYDGMNSIQERQGGVLTAQVLTGFGADEVLARTSIVGGVPTTSNYLTDLIGSVVAMTDGAGSIQSSWTYEPYGVSTLTGAASSNSQKFTAREEDFDFLMYYRSRYYSPVLQRFLSEDPAFFSAGTNLYQYVHGNPTAWSDPTGMAMWDGTAPPGCSGKIIDYQAFNKSFTSERVVLEIPTPFWFQKNPQYETDTDPPAGSWPPRKPGKGGRGGKNPGTPIGPGMVVDWYMIVGQKVERTTTLMWDKYETVLFICRTVDQCGNINTYSYTANFEEHWQHTNPPEYFWRWYDKFMFHGPWDWPRP